jgi:amino acid adenylation domain-containing protein
MARGFSKQLPGASPSDPKRALLARLLEKNDAVRVSPLATGPVRRSGEPAPLSFAQERLWFLQQWNPASPVYNLTRAYRLSGPLDGALLARSVDAIARRHESLRTSFTGGAEQPRQLISQKHTPAIETIDLRQLPARARRLELARRLAGEARRPFDLALGPLLRLSLFQLGSRDHVLLLAAHQIIFDGRSLDIFYRELEILYAAGGDIECAALPELALQYGDYAAWQRRARDDAALAGQLSYWKTQLGGSLPILQLPTDRPRVAALGLTGARQKIAIDAALTGALKDIGRRSSTTLFATLMAAFMVLLYRYTALEDMVVGFPVSQRDRPEFENLIGFFVNTLALRGDLSGAPTFRQLLARVRAELQGALANGEVPFERLVEALPPKRDFSRNPLFQTMFAFQNRLPADLRLTGLRTEALDCDTGTSKFDLTLALGERDRRLVGTFEYNSELFDGATIARMAVHFQILLQAIVDDPDCPIASLPMLSADERRRVLVGWNDTRADYPKEKCLQELFEAQARSSPKAIAVECAGARVHYGELNRRANRLAHYLKSLGVGPQALVGICLERSVEMVVALLAILKAGAAYLPLDPEYPRERLEFILADSQAKFLLTKKALDRRLELSSLASARKLTTILLPRDREKIARHSVKNPAKRNHPNSRAYVIFTSGSTGQPKGVEIEHRALVNCLFSMGRQLDISKRDVWLAVTTISFDIAAAEIFLPLISGAKLVVASRDDGRDGERLLRKINNARATMMQATPSTWRLMLEAGWPGAPQLTMICGGEALPRQLADELLGCGKALWNFYGPTETTIWSASCRVESGQAAVPIGQPLANTEIYLLDGQLQPVPIGVAGGIYIGGAGLARGYLNQPEQTQARFIANPFARNSSARLYRTGDLGRYLPNGEIEFLGRTDDQVKIRGHRIELGEIEATLCRNPLVRQCVVVVCGGTADSKFQISDFKSQNSDFERALIAYLVPSSESVPDTAELQLYLRQTLPEVMVPAAFVVLDALPLTPNGKVDRKSLPAPDYRLSRLAPEFTAPRGEIEELVAETWREVLGLEEIGAEDNFFDLGGHSLLATRVAARLRGSFNIELALRKLFELPTVSLLAAHVGELRRTQSGIIAAPIAPAPRGGALPLSSAQRRLWFLHKLDPDADAYNIPAAYRISGVVDAAALHAALNEIVRRHESLRTAIVEDHGRPIQRILASAELPLPLVDLTRLPANQASAEVLRLVAEDAHLPYDLAAAPLMRAQLLRLDHDQHVFILNFHHIIADASSLGDFYRELAILYDGFIGGSPPALATLPVQYADYSAWQQEWLASPAAKTQLAYWRGQLSGAVAPLELPADFARPARQSYRGARLSKRLPAALTGALKSLSRRQGATLFMTLLAAFNILLARLSGRRDIVIGSTIAGRSRPEVQGVIGFFVNALALRSDLTGDPSFTALLRHVREVCLDAYTHQELPFDCIVEALNPERDLSRNPLFQVMFNMNDTGARSLMLNDCQSEKINSAEPAAKFDMILYAPQVDGAIELTMVYDAELFSAARIALSLEQLGAILEQAVAAPEQSIERYSLVTPMSLSVLPDPAAPLSERWEGAVQALISRQAQTDPERPAVTDDSDSWSYRELDKQSSQLANYFVQSGIRQHDVIAVCAQRSASLAVALLGVLKAGAVFVVFDPAYPAARLLDYLRIARPRAWVELEPAGELPEELENFLATSKLCCRVSLPVTQSEIARLLDGHSANAPDISVGADDPAYIAFTSGSTGHPKGVLGRHGPMSHFLPWQEETFAHKNSDRYCLMSGLGYNHLQREIFTALAGGAALFVPTSAELKEPRQLARWLRQHEITVLHMTPALGRLLCTAGEKLPAARRIFFGGDALMRSDVEAMRACAPNAKLVSFYGATETQRAVGYYEIPSHDPNANGDQRAPNLIPVGRGAKDVQLLLLTAHRQIAGVGELAELYIRSPHLAAGYLHDDELTAANFLANPFIPSADDRSDRLYRSAEFGRYTLDGNVEWVGRSERRASVRGFRVELAEVEAALSRHPSVGQVTVVAKTAPSTDGARSEISDQYLVAYVEAAAGQICRASELRDFLMGQLPHYMVPAHFQFTQALPLGPNGKVDYAKLAGQNEPDELDESVADSQVGFEAPRPGIEVRLAELFCQVLGVARIGRHDNFFHLGGHSLLAAQAAARIRQALGVGLDLRTFFEAPTVEVLAQRVEALHDLPASEREEIEL